MEQRTITSQERAALVALLDDPSPAVRQALLERFNRSGGSARGLLDEAAHGDDATVAAAARWFLRELRFSDPSAEFRGFIQSLNYELETGALLLARVVNPQLEPASVCTQLDAFAARARRLMPKSGPLRSRCLVLNRVLFDEFGLAGDTENFADPRNSLIDQVLERRLGLPISLSVIYLLVAQRVGLELEPVGAPGHFLVGGYEPEGPFFIDAFNSGRFLSPEDVFERIRELNRHPQLADLAPTPVREVLSRMCRNLVNHFTAAEDRVNARLFAGFVAEFEATYERHASS